MGFGEVAATIKDALTGRRVFGEPIEQGGVVVIPAAMVFGGGGGGVGTVKDGPQEGGGFGLLARPVGAFVISGGRAEWVPALDATRLITAVIGGLCFLAWQFARTRRKRLGQ